MIYHLPDRKKRDSEQSTVCPEKKKKKRAQKVYSSSKYTILYNTLLRFSYYSHLAPPIWFSSFVSRILSTFRRLRLNERADWYLMVEIYISRSRFESTASFGMIFFYRSRVWSISSKLFLEFWLSIISVVPDPFPIYIYRLLLSVARKKKENKVFNF